MPKIPDVATFVRCFGDDAACVAHLREKRWGPNLERFVCPACGHERGWWLPTRGLVECRDCHHQTSPTAGTAFHGARVPLWKWFWAMYQEAHSKKGIAAMALAKQIQVCYQTAWAMLHKLREAMKERCQHYVLKGVVEIDETYVGGKEPGRPGRGVEKKVPVAVAVELDENRRPKRIAMGGLERVDARSLKDFTTRHVEKGSSLRTDGWGSYVSVAKAGYEHEAIVTGGGKEAVERFPWVHTFIGNLKRMILGTYHSVSPQHLERYLAAFVYRANRRWMEANLFDRLVVAAMDAKPLTYKELTAGAK
jgi:hypothetical protein